MSTVTSTAFNALPTDGTADGFYVISDGTSEAIDASDVSYNNTASGLSAVNVQGAIDEMSDDLTDKADNVQTFTEATTRSNINSGETISTLFGKVKKFFTDLKAVAFSGSYNDLSDKPTIPTDTNQLTNGAGFITSTGSCSYATSAGSAGSASTAGNVTGTVAIANGGTGATSRLVAISNFFNQNVATPNYVIGLTERWASCGYTSISQLQSALSIPAGLSNHLDSKTNVSSVSYACNAGYGNYLILAFIQNVGCVMLTIMVQSGNPSYKSLCARTDAEVASLVVATYTVNTITINFTYSASFVSLRLAL